MEEKEKKGILDVYLFFVRESHTRLLGCQHLLASDPFYFDLIVFGSQE